MLSILNSSFITFIYQPFFNLLVYIYLVLDKATGGGADMGTALIIFTFIFRIILLPLSNGADRSEKEKREIKARVAEIEKILTDTAKDLGPAGKDTRFGAGLVDALKAVKAARGEGVLARR